MVYSGPYRHIKASIPVVFLLVFCPVVHHWPSSQISNRWSLVLHSSCQTIAQPFTTGFQLDHQKKTTLTAGPQSDLRGFSFGGVFCWPSAWSSEGSCLRDHLCYWSLEQSSLNYHSPEWFQPSNHPPELLLPSSLPLRCPTDLLCSFALLLSRLLKASSSNHVLPLSCSPEASFFLSVKPQIACLGSIFHRVYTILQYIQFIWLHLILSTPWIWSGWQWLNELLACVCVFSYLTLDLLLKTPEPAKYSHSGPIDALHQKAVIWAQQEHRWKAHPFWEVYILTCFTHHIHFHCSRSV